MISDHLKEAKQKMEMAADHVGNEFSTVRTGRANPQLLHRITVDYYGTPTPLQQLASISVPEPRLLMVQPFDASTLGDIERSLQQADLGLTGCCHCRHGFALEKAEISAEPIVLIWVLLRTLATTLPCLRDWGVLKFGILSIKERKLMT